MWNTLIVDISLDDLLARPVLGRGCLTRGEAHAEVQKLLDADPRLSDAAEQWRTDAPRVRIGSMVWTIYEYEDDLRTAALARINAQLEGFRGAGVNIRVGNPSS